MGKRVIIASAGLVLLMATVAVTGGPENRGDFDIFVDEVQGLNREYDRTTYDTAQGWDFGDRAAYACAFVEHFTGGALDFEMHLELFDDYPAPIEINDRNGQESQEGTFTCGDGIGKGTNLVYSEAEYGDHFPHGTDLVFYRDVDGDGFVDDEFARIVYSETPCGQAYWTPGNEAGEAVLWWDEDGAADQLEHGDGLCGGGPGEAIAVAVTDIQDVAAGVGYCVLDSMDGDLCVGVTAEPSPSPSPSPTDPPVLECFSGELASEVDQHLEPFRVCVVP